MRRIARPEPVEPEEITPAEAVVLLRRLRARLIAVDQFSAGSDLGRRKRSAREELDALHGGDLARLEAARAILVEHGLERILELVDAR